MLDVYGGIHSDRHCIIRFTCILSKLDTSIVCKWAHWGSKMLNKLPQTTEQAQNPELQTITDEDGFQERTGEWGVFAVYPVKFSHCDMNN